MGEDGKKRCEVDPAFHLNEQSYHKVMETASLPFKQPDHLATVVGSDNSKEKLVNGHETKSNVPTQAVIQGKTKVKKKIEDIITNLKKVKQVASTENDSSSSAGPQEEEASSFASMCTIRDDPPDLDDLPDLPPLAHDSGHSSEIRNKKPPSLPRNVVHSPKVVQTTPSTSNPQKPVRQVILKTVPTNQQTPIILNKLSPGFIIRNDLPSRSLANLPNTSTSGQPKLLLITKAGGGPIYLTQNINTSTNQNQGKPVTKPNSSPLQAKPFFISKKSPGSPKGKPVNLNKNIVGLSSPTSKASTETPLITVQYNLPYPNNNCKVVNNPLRTVQNAQPVTFQTLDSLQRNDKVLLTAVPLATKPREMVVNFAGNQTAHITTMSEETGILPEKQTRFIPSFVYGSAPEASAIRNNTLSPVDERRKAKIVKLTAPATASNVTTKEPGYKKVHLPMAQKRFTYDEKIAKLTGKGTNLPPAQNDEGKTLSNGLKKKSNIELSSVRVSNRKRQQTEKAKLFEKDKKRKKNEEKSPAQENKEKIRFLDIKVKAEKPDDYEMTSPNVVSPEESLSKSPSKKSKSAQSPQQTLHENEADSTKEKEDDPGSLFRDPALLTREERALQRALMRFKELEEEQARKETVTSEVDKTSSRKKANLLNKTEDVPRKRKITNEGRDEIDMKKRKQEMEKQSVEKNTNVIQPKDAEHERKNSDIVDKMIKQKMHLPIENSPVHLNESGKQKDTAKKSLVKKAETNTAKETMKDTPSSTKEIKNVKTVKDVANAPKPLKHSPKTPESASERHRVKTYMLVPSYHGFKDFSPVVLGTRTRSRKTEPVKTEKEEEVPVATTPEKTKKDIPLLVIETVGNKAVKQDVVANDEELRDLVKTSLRAQGMLKQELELSEKNKDADQFENREKRNLTVNRNTGETVLHKAARMGYDETVYHCIQQGSDSNAKDNAGWTPLHEACSRGHSDVVRVLAQYNADVHACSTDGIRPIHDAADNGHIDSLRILMAYGADPFISTYSGRSVVDCAKRTEAKDFIKACIDDLYLNDERNNIASPDYDNRWDFRSSSSFLDKDRKYLGDIFENVPKQQSSNSVEFEWSETPHLPTYSLPLVTDAVIVGRKNYILLKDLQQTLNKPRQNVVKMLKRTKIWEMSWSEFQKEISSSYFNRHCECPRGSGTEPGNVELVPLNRTVRSLLKIKCEHLAL